jgi:hypothetical protein
MLGAPAVFLAEPVAQAEPPGKPAHLVALACADECHSDPSVACTAGATDTVDIRLMVGGRVEVDDM